jgi:hypothetical protein
MLQGRADVIGALKLIFMSYLDTYNKDDLQELKELITVNNRHTNVVEKKLKMLNLNILGEGGCRVVVHNENHDCVIKFRKKEDKYEENKTEAETYNRLKEKPVSNLLVPIIEHTKNFDTIVQEKIDQSNTSKRDVLKISALLIYNYGYFSDDIHLSNIGMYKNNSVNVLKINDYGRGVDVIENTKFTNKHEAFERAMDAIDIKI